jgi:catecholate siderophore receptor
VAATAPTTHLLFPNNYLPYDGFIVPNGAYTETLSDTAAVYLFDTIKFNDCWELAGGVRWDSYKTEYNARTADVTTRNNNTGVLTFTPGVLSHLHSDDSEFSYRAALTYKPVHEGSIYLAYGTSFNPSSESLTYIAPPAANNNTLSLFNAEPEKNETIELGAKWEFFDERLLLTGAVFRTEKTNARTTDPVDPTVVSLTGEQVVEGFEVGFTGSVTDNFRLIGGYTYLSSEVKSSLAYGEEGSEVSNTPENSFSLWAVYDLPKNFTVGLGTQYVDSRFNNNSRATRQEAPDFFLVNAMAGYQVNEHLAFRLNLDNILDEEYIDRVGGGHFVPGQGRAVFLSADLSF